MPHTGTGPARPHLAPAHTGPVPQIGVPLPSQRPSQPGNEGNATAGPSSYKPSQAKPLGTSKWSKPVELRTDPRAVGQYPLQDAHMTSSANANLSAPLVGML